MSNMHNSPKVKIHFYEQFDDADGRTAGFTADFEVGWTHTSGHDRFREELTKLLDSLSALSGGGNHARL